MKHFACIAIAAAYAAVILYVAAWYISYSGVL